MHVFGLRMMEMLVPSIMEPTFVYKLLAVCGEGSIFATSNIGTTQMTDAVRYWWQPPKRRV